MQVQEGRRLLLALWWPLDCLPWEPRAAEGWQQPRNEREESQEVCGNGLSLTAQRRGTFSGAGEAQAFPQHFQLCGCPQVNSKGSVEKAGQFLEAQQGHWGQKKQKNQVFRAEISFCSSPFSFSVAAVGEHPKH